jgi:hypothetical protein
MEQNERYLDLDVSDLLEVTLQKPDDFLKVRETLTRIGVSSRTEKKLWQSCHILHKRGKYYIVHFKEMFALDDLPTSIDSEDIGRRNTIACLLEEWGLLKIVNKAKIADKVHVNKIKILSFKEKNEWELCTKYHIGRSKKTMKPEE